MSNLQTQNNTPVVGVKSLSNFLNSDAIKSKFAEVLGDKDKGVSFVTSILSVVNSNGALGKADQNSLYTAALMAATLDLPINPSIGHAYLVPFKTRQADGSYKDMVQFQLSAKGIKQLAMRSGQFLTINDSDVREGEIETVNRLTGEIKFNWIQDDKERLSKPVVGYVCYFKLVNGFESTMYMTSEQMMEHAKKYSMTFKKFGTGLWKDEFGKMASKTIIKLHLAKNAPLSTSMQKAMVSDQAVIKNDNFTNQETVDIEVEYADNQTTVLDITDVNNSSMRERVIEHITNSTTLEKLEECEAGIGAEDHELIVMFDDKKRELTKSKKK